MLKIGLTGGICSGKSVVSALFAEQDDMDILNADQIVKNLCSPRGAAFENICEEFGPEIIDGSGEIDREVLAGIVFSNPERLADLELIIHPLVKTYIEDELLRLKSQCVIVEIPLLYEAKFDDFLDKVVVVACTEDLQIERCKMRDGLSEQEVRQRMARQMPLRDKVARGDFIIDNNMDIEQTRRQVESIWAQIKMENQEE